jgi:thioredoxin-related protein
MNSLKYIVFLVPALIVTYFVNHKVETRKSIDNELVWQTNIEEAYKISKKTGKPVMADFTGSDWCGWCHRLSKEVFNTPEFKVWSDKNVVLLELDFPKTKVQSAELKNQNNSLMQFFQVQGFPTIHLFNLNRNNETKKFDIDPIGGTGYMAGGPVVFTNALDGMITKYKEAKKIKTAQLKSSKTTKE